MSFPSPREAKRFFVERILQQAAVEKIALSEAERYMLSWSESDPGFQPDSELAAALDAEIPEEEYEAKISGLLERAYARDVAAEPGMKARFKEAYARLAEGDHYILVMINRALGRKLKAWWQF